MPSFLARTKKRKIENRIIIPVVLYVLVLAALVAFLGFDKVEEKETFGSLEGRFTSEITMDVQGKTLHYRENEITNYLIIGMDRREVSAGEYERGGQADFLLMLSIDRRNRTITPVMIDRDTMASVTTYGVFGDVSGMRTTQICLAQAFSGKGVTGSRNTASAVSRLLQGVKVDYYLLMDLEGIALLNDTVGGVSVTLQDDFSSMDPAMTKGATIRLNGEQAEYFVRGRMTVADGTNASRMRRQQQYLSELVRLIASEARKDDTKLNAIYQALSGHIESDRSGSLMLSDANTYIGYEWKNMQTFAGTHTISEDGFAEFWVDEEALRNTVARVWFE